MIETERLVVRPWRDEDRAPMAAMQADAEVMWDYGRLFDSAESGGRVDRYDDAYRRFGYGRFPVLHKSDGAFLGFCGIMPIPDGHPMYPGTEIGWRFTRAAWGHGYATEAARACLRHGFDDCGLREVWSYTRFDNRRSEAVMKRLGLTFVPDRFWDHEDQHFIVYVARA